MTLSVNLSARQLVEPTLVEAVETILKRTGFPGTQLHLEVTESVIMQHPKLFTVVLGQLKELGLHISIDDFGTGYSSLSYLHLFPVDSLKIDRSFVSSMQSLDKQKRIVETIVLLARNLGIAVIAEGVEGDDQHQALRTLGCELAQGFHFSRPVDAVSARRLVESGLVAGGFGL
jgi:EAL domain-containing protein (putative c-di-GMP-specific phosphodiesterase class I)